MKELTYTYGTTIAERIKHWAAIEMDETDSIYCEQWKKRKSLLNSKDYEKLFRYYGCTEQEFNQGISQFTEAKAKKLEHVVETSEWYHLHQQLFLTEIPYEKKTLHVALRYHLNYYRAFLVDYLIKNPLIHCTEQIINDMVKQLSDELFFLAQKTLVWDVHAMIEEYQIKGETKEEEFEKYIDEFLGDKERTYLFFGEYPTLARLLVTRLIYACQNSQAFFDGVQQSIPLLEKKFAICQPVVFSKVKLGLGDSHNQGKTVIQFTINTCEFIFKFKSLEIGERFNTLLNYIETLQSNASFYKVQRIVYPTFTIEEKVSYQQCKTLDEVAKFYKNYGHLLAIVYWLGSSDLHMENVIAHGEFPVFIDVETLFKAEMFEPIKKLEKRVQIEKESILISGLIPQKRNNYVKYRIDALSGNQQTFTQTINRLMNEHSSDISFQPVSGYMQSAQNIPMYQGEEVDYKDYTNQIEQGFSEMNHCLLKHKMLVIEKIAELFSNVRIRLVYRNTQDYANLLHYAAHTECMSDYSERERMLQNIWHIDSLPQEIITQEMNALLGNDIPFFEADTSLKHIYTNEQKIIGILNSTPIEHTLERIKKITEKTVNFSLLLLRESLGTLSYQRQKISVPYQNQSLESAFLQRAADIGDLIVQQISLDETNETAYWLSVVPDDENHASIDYPTNDMYQGSAGIYLFLACLNHFVPKKTYQSLIQVLEREVFSSKSDKEHLLSAFFGPGMRLWISFYLATILNEKKYIHYMYQSLEQVKEQLLNQPKNQNEYLYGQSSLLALLARIYQKYPDSTILDTLMICSETINLCRMDDNSFAHGYAGVLYGLIMANKQLQTNQIEYKIRWYQEKFEQQLNTEKRGNTSWCRGSVGIQKICELLNISFFESNQSEIDDDCICHGNHSQAQFLNDVERVQQQKYFQLKSDRYNIPISLFCGLAGIGYQYLERYDNKTIHSLLFI